MILLIIRELLSRSFVAEVKDEDPLEGYIKYHRERHVLAIFLVLPSWYKKILRFPPIFISFASIRAICDLTISPICTYRLYLIDINQLHIKTCIFADNTIYNFFYQENVSMFVQKSNIKQKYLTTMHFFPSVDFQ